MTDQLAQFLESSDVIEYVQFSDAMKITSCNGLFLRHTGITSGSITDHTITEFLTAHDTQLVLSWAATNVPAEPVLLNFLTARNELYTLRCTVSTTEDGFAIAGEPPRSDADLTEQLIRLNNGFASLSREHVRANLALREANRKLNEFLGMAAHDLRNPLTVMIGASKLLLHLSSVDEKSTRLLSTIHSSSQYMLRLVEDLLDISRIEAGDINLKTEVVDVVALVERNVDLNRLLADPKKIAIDLDVQPGIPLITLDPHKIEQVLTNLISNGVKYSFPESRVSVTLRIADAEVVIDVRDQGAGIPAGEMDRLFKAFGRTSVRGTAGEKSTGLGLLIAKKIVDAHGGRIEVQSEEGVGSTFSMALPITA